MMRLKGKVAVVTGSGSGIGKSICEIFAKEGAKVVVSSRRAINGQPVADNINTNIGKAIFVKCDISKKDDIDNLFKATMEKYGTVDILINNAGVNFVKEFTNITVEDWENMVL
jgi:NAD(P)-dependent dehydrogenase (short-subunit alcohol dehydrogenase family)